jgi:hypothetical protein
MIKPCIRHRGWLSGKRLVFCDYWYGCYWLSRSTLRSLGWDAPNSPVKLCGCLPGCHCHTTAEIIAYLLIGVRTVHGRHIHKCSRCYTSHLIKLLLQSLKCLSIQMMLTRIMYCSFPNVSTILTEIWRCTHKTPVVLFFILLLKLMLMIS